MAEHDHESHSRPSLDAAMSAQSRVRRLRTLPPLPRTSQLLLQMLSDPDLDMLCLAEIVEQTPALAGRILGVANSAFFARATAVRDIPDAIIRVLGLHLVRDLSISFILSQPFDLNDCPRFDPMRYWTTAMESAVLAQLLAVRLPVVDTPTPAEAYLGGLLHNLGLLALVHVAPDLMEVVFARAEREQSEGLSTIEHQVLGLDHGVAGGELAMAWQLPPQFAAAMGPISERSRSGQHRTLMSLLLLCSQMRPRLCAGSDVTEDPAVVAACAELGLAFAAVPKLVAQWRHRSADIAALAAAFAGARR